MRNSFADTPVRGKGSNDEEKQIRSDIRAKKVEETILTKSNKCETRRRRHASHFKLVLSALHGDRKRFLAILPRIDTPTVFERNERSKNILDIGARSFFHGAPPLSSDMNPDTF